MSDLSNKVILITGASSGIGEATARELAAAGAKLMIGARRTERLEALAGELGGNVAWARLDVTDRESFAQFVAAAEERFGRVDVLVNNAGVMLGPDAIARAIRFAVEQPAEVDVSEIIVRPTVSNMS